jgi:hypothetical protein
VEVPRYPLETSSTFATFMLLEEDPSLVAVIPSAVAAFAEQRGLLVSLAVRLRALSEPFGVVHRVGCHCPMRRNCWSKSCRALSADGPQSGPRHRQNCRSR